MTTREAFEKLMTIRGVHHDLGIENKTWMTIRYNYRRNKVSLEKMEELLTAAGFKKIPEKWVEKN